MNKADDAIHCKECNCSNNIISSSSKQTYVPMLAPMTMKMAGSTGTEPAPTNATIIDVVVLDDWSSTVTIIPTMREATGLVFPPKSPAAAHPVNTLAPVLSSSREKMNQ
jgi:hypothetical protein